MTQVNLFMKQKQTRRRKEQPCGCQGGGGVWGEMELEFGIIRCKMIAYRMHKQQGSTI